MLGGHVRRRLSPQAASWGLRPVGDQDHGPLSGWLAERRLKKALPSSQRKRRAMQGQRPAGDSPPRPSDRPRSGDSLLYFSQQIEPAPDYLSAAAAELPAAAAEPPEARQTADTKTEAASGHERAGAASSL